MYSGRRGWNAQWDLRLEWIVMRGYGIYINKREFASGFYLLSPVILTKQLCMSVRPFYNILVIIILIL